MAENPERNPGRGAVVAVAVVLAALFFWQVPLFRIVPPKTAGVGAVEPSGGGLFDPTAAAARIWQTDLPAAIDRALEAGSLAGLLRSDPATARAKFARSAGLGAAYYFVRGRGRVVSRDRSSVRIALTGDSTVIVALRLGPVFGNTVRDGCGLLDVNSFPGLTEFNALASALNDLVEKNILPSLQTGAVVGAEVDFAGCAEAPETASPAGEPLLLLTPVRAEVRP